MTKKFKTPAEYNAAKKKRSAKVGDVFRGNTKYIDVETKEQRNYAVVSTKGSKVKVAKVKSIKSFDKQGNNADSALVEINAEKYGLEKRSGVDYQVFYKNRMSQQHLDIEDDDVFPEEEKRFSLNSKDKHKVLIHTKIINDPKKKKKRDK